MADVSVRPAAAEDAPVLAAVQVSAWRTGYAELLPRATLDAMTGQQAAFADQWQTATTRPPSRVHRVLVACEGAQVVGGAAIGPASDDDLNPAVAAEIHSFVVDPQHRRLGHGSRMLSAAVDFMRGDGFVSATVWVDGNDDPSRALFAASGWAPDGSHRTLDLEGDGTVTVQQVRLHTDLAEGE
jgi:GNAT superfamily N-acetyltransferase